MASPQCTTECQTLPAPYIFRRLLEVLRPQASGVEGGRGLGGRRQLSAWGSVEDYGGSVEDYIFIYGGWRQHALRLRHLMSGPGAYHSGCECTHGCQMSIDGLESQSTAVVASREGMWMASMTVGCGVWGRYGQQR